MNDAAIRELLSRVAALERQQVRLRMGEVTGDGVDVALGGAAASYADVKQLVGTGLAGGQQVACLARGNDLLVLGGVHGQMGLPRVTSLPASPRHGQEILFETGTAGVVWRLSYNALSASAYKWEYVGGPALAKTVETDEAVVSATYVDAATSGPSITVPLAGDYLIRFGSECYTNTAGAALFMYTAPKVGAAATSDVDAVVPYSAGFLQVHVPSRELPVKTLAAAAVLKLQYKTNDGTKTGQYRKRWLSALPVRVG